MTFELTDLNGTPTGLTGSTSVPGNGQIALFLNQIEGFESLMLPFRGVLRISTGSSSGVSVVSLRGRYNERTDFLITTTPPSNEADTASTSEFLFPHLVDSGGYTTQFVLFSGTGLTSAGTVSFHEQSGGSLGLRLN